MRTTKNYTTFTKLPIFDDAIRIINIDMPLSNISTLFMHCYDDLSNQSIKTLYDEYNVFIEKKLVTSYKPIDILANVVVTSNSIDHIFTFNLTTLISNKILNSIDILNITDVNGLFIRNISLSENATISMQLKITTKKLLLLGSQKLSMYIKITDDMNLIVE